MNHTGRTDVYPNKADPHMEYVRGNYWLSTVSYSLQASCIQSERTTMQEKAHNKENKVKCATPLVNVALLKI